MFSEDPIAVVKYKQLKYTIKFNTNSSQIFRSIITNTEITSANKTPKPYMETMLLSTPDCCPQQQTNV